MTRRRNWRIARYWHTFLGGSKGLARSTGFRSAAHRFGKSGTTSGLGKSEAVGWARAKEARRQAASGSQRAFGRAADGGFGILGLFAGLAGHLQLVMDAIT